MTPLITGDEYLIEYISRLTNAVKSIREDLIKKKWKESIEKFICHYVWHTSDTRRHEGTKLWSRLESRLIEMKERRKRLILNLYKKEKQKGKVKTESNKFNSFSMITDNEKKEFDLEYEKKLYQKNTILQGMSAKELEENLKDFAYAGRRQSRESTRNVAHEVIACLIDLNHGGKAILTDIIKWLKVTNQRIVTTSQNRKLTSNYIKEETNMSILHEKNRIVFD